MIRRKTVSRALEIKETTREQLEGEVREARVRLDRELEKLESLERSHRDTSAEFTGRQLAGSLSIREMDLYYTYLKHLARQSEQQKKIIAIRREDVEARQLAMLEAYREHRLVEILRDKLLHQESRQSGKAEQQEADYSFLTRKVER